MVTEKCVVDKSKMKYYNCFILYNIVEEINHMSKMSPQVKRKLLAMILTVLSTGTPCRASGEYDVQIYYHLIEDDNRSQSMPADYDENNHESSTNRLNSDEEENLSSANALIWGIPPQSFEKRSPVPFDVRMSRGELPTLGNESVTVHTPDTVPCFERRSPVPFDDVRMSRGKLPILGDESVPVHTPDTVPFSGSDKSELLAPIPKRPAVCCVNDSISKEKLSDDHLKKFPTKRLLKEKLEQALKLMLPESRKECESKDLIVDLKGTTAVVGDVHGDFLTVYAIINRLKFSLGKGELDNVVLLGDYIDRGKYSAATLYELLNFYLENPKKVTLLRGNHETVSQYVGDFGYVSAAKEPQFLAMAKDSHPTSKTPTLSPEGKDDPFSDCPELLSRFFEALPIGAVINKSTLAVHGGVPNTMRWACFSDMFHMRYGCMYTFNNIWSTIMGVLWSDYNPTAKINTPGSRGISDDLLIDSQYNDETAKIFLNYLNGKHHNFLNLKYLIHGHQWTFGTFHQSAPDPTVTTVFSALDNQSPEVRKQGATVALIKDDFPPVKWFTVDVDHHIAEGNNVYSIVPPRSGSGGCEIKICCNI